MDISNSGPWMTLLGDSALLLAGFTAAILFQFFTRWRQDRKPLYLHQSLLSAAALMFGLSLFAAALIAQHGNPGWRIAVPLWLAPLAVPAVISIIGLYGDSSSRGLKSGNLLLADAVLAGMAVPACLLGGWWQLLLLGPAAGFGFAAYRFGRFFARRRAGWVRLVGLAGFGAVVFGLLSGALSFLPGLAGAGLVWYAALALVQAGIFGIVVCFTLIEERHVMVMSQTALMACEELEYVRAHDPLTGLHHREAFHHCLNELLGCQARPGEDLALLFLDLDHFRDINDSLDSQTGDLLLQAVAERLTVIVADTERLFRSGEDEFAIIIPCTGSRSQATAVAEEILASFNQQFPIGGTEVYLTASIGIAFAELCDGKVVLPAELCQQADTALRHAKLDRNTYRFFTVEIGEHGLTKLQYFNYLRQAIDRHELCLHFQPQVDQHGKVISAEALLRWNNPVLGSVPPSEFIPVAEEAGLIIPIGDWVIERACAELAHWRSIGLNIPLAINISPRQLKDSRLEYQLLSRLRKYGLRPEIMHLEITESSLINDTDNTIGILQSLARAGFAMSIDDFGTGYANLSWLKHLPVNTLKIDRSFVVDLSSNEQDLAVVQAIVSIAKCRGMTTIAEGVDSSAQLELLLEADCRIIQGFFYSRPLPSAQFIDYALSNAG